MDVFDLLRCAVSLAAVFGALWFLHRRLTKGPKIGRGGPRVRARSIEVVARHGLGAKAGVAVVDVDGQRYLLGVTEHAVNVLDRLGPAGAASVVPDPAAAAPSVTAHALAPAVAFERELEAAELAESTEQPIAPPPTVTTVTAAVVVQQTTSAGAPAVAILPLAPFPTRRAAREAAQALPAAGESPQDEFERMLHAVVAEDPSLPAAPQEPRMSRRPSEPQQSASPLAGSVLHPETWRQTVAALRRLR